MVLKYLRESRKLSLRKVGLIMGKSGTLICHLEHGRSDLTPHYILKILNIYGYVYENFIELVKGNRALPQSLYAECVEILKRLDYE